MIDNDVITNIKIYQIYDNITIKLARKIVVLYLCLMAAFETSIVEMSPVHVIQHFDVYVECHEKAACDLF